MNRFVRFAKVTLILFLVVVFVALPFRGVGAAGNAPLASPRNPRMGRGVVHRTPPSCPQGGPGPAKAHLAAGSVVDVDLPSDSTGMPGGTLALRIYAPASSSDARYTDGAPVVIYVPGSDTAGTLSVALPQADDMIRIVFLFPGGSNSVSGRHSDGTYDHRGPNCIAALRDVIKYAAGNLTDSDGKTIDDRLAVPVLHNNIGLIGASNGGNIVTAVAAQHGAEFAGHLRYIVQWESPVSSQIATVDLGGVMLDCPGGRRTPLEVVNPRYHAYGPLTIDVDYSQITYDATALRRPIFLDGTGDGHYTTVLDPSTGCQTPDLNHNGTLETDEDFPLSSYTDGVKQFYSRAATQAMADRYLFGGSWPGNIATVAQANSFWDLREAVRLYHDAQMNIPGLEGMVLVTVIDHVQATPDKPHIRQAFEGWNSAGAWVQINPNPTYLVEADPSLSGRTDLPHNAPNTPPADWRDVTDYAMPENVSNNVLQSAAIRQMADRAHAASSATPTPTVTASLTASATPSPAASATVPPASTRTATPTLTPVFAPYCPLYLPLITRQWQPEPATQTQTPVAVSSASPFGVAYGEGSSKLDHFMDYIHDLGLHRTKVSFYWSKLEPKPGKYNFSNLDEYLHQLGPADQGLFNIFTNGWCTNEQAEGSCKGATLRDCPYGASSCEKSCSEWYSEFITAVAEHVRDNANGGIKYFQRDTEPASVHHYPADKPEEYVETQKLFYKAVKSVLPDMPVIGVNHNSSGFTRNWEPMELKFFDYVLEHARDYYDILDLRLYNDIYSIPNRVNWFRERMQYFGYEKPIVSTEQGGPDPRTMHNGQTYLFSNVMKKVQKSCAHVDNYWKCFQDWAAAHPDQVDPKLQMFLQIATPEQTEIREQIHCHDITQRNVMMLASGVQATWWWNLQSYGTTPIFGDMRLRTEKFEELPGYACYQRMVSELGSVTAVKRVTLSDDSVYFFEVRRSGEEMPMYVAWRRARGLDPYDSATAAPKNVSLPVPFTSVKMVDVFGHEAMKTTSDGVLAVSLSDTPLFIKQAP